MLPQMRKIITAFSFIPTLLLLACSSEPDSAPTYFDAMERGAGLMQTGDKVVTIAAVGDISCDTRQRLKYPCKDSDVADLIRSRNVDHVVLLGDIQYENGSHKEFLLNFGRIWEDLLPISLPLPGNHEYYQQGAAGYFESFPSQEPPGYYSVNLNETWKIIALNTNDRCRHVGCDSESVQYGWLKEQIQSERKCIIAASHHPRYSSGVHGNAKFMDDIFNLLQDASVPLLLSAHDHHYERFSTNPVQVISGAGGKLLRKARKNDESVVIDDKYGAVFITIVNTKIFIEFADTGGNVLDRTSIDCNIGRVAE